MTFARGAAPALAHAALCLAIVGSAVVAHAGPSSPPAKSVQPPSTAPSTAAKGATVTGVAPAQPKPGGPSPHPAPNTVLPKRPSKNARASTPVTGYQSAIKGWHAAPAGKSPPEDDQGRPMFALFALNTQESLVVPVLTEEGAMRSEDLDHVARLLREPSSGHEHPLDPRLVALAYRVQRHFHATELRVISGYRTPKKNSHSNHGRGRALDFIVPGTTDDEVAKYCRELGFVGVGIYPTSGFVHLDVRDRSYFWVDASAPGRKNRERGIAGDLAQKSDAMSRERGEHPTATYGPVFGVETWLKTHGAGAAPTPSEEDDATEGEGEGESSP